ncbi:MAG TPA: DUF4157 domain-containing protein, partial [Ktedonobacteraceae bacterium]|nr:DUF4157 domain-containing protein [Ktedonobacteraceae bacterium]
KKQAKTTGDASSKESLLQRANVTPPLNKESIVPSEGRFGHDFSCIPVHHRLPEALQTKLTIGQIGDKYEQEADRVADTVMRMPTVEGLTVQSIGSAPANELHRQTEHDKTKNTAARGSAKSTTTPTRKEIQRVEFLRRLAASPGLALDSWKRLKSNEQIFVVMSMSASYGVDFAKRFLTAASKLPRREDVIIITNNPDFTPKRLEASGYKLYSSGNIQVWIHPTGKEIWLIPNSQSLPQQRTEEKEEGEEIQIPNSLKKDPFGVGPLQAPDEVKEPAPSSLQLQMPEFKPKQQEGFNLPKLHLNSDEDETLQRKESGSGTVASATHEQEVPPIVHNVLHSSGLPLDSSTRSFMESRFGHDFSGVRVHTGARADQSAQAVNAQAYTVGRDVVFGAGRYAPETTAGKRLLAHELTHVVQQSANPLANISTASGFSISSPTDDQELAANKMASRVMTEVGPVPEAIPQVPAMTRAQSPSGITIQRFPAGHMGHQGIEEEALIGESTDLKDEKLQFKTDDVKNIYLGNWLRDLSQLPSPLLVKILTLGEFGREISEDELGTYIPSEHLDNPEGSETIENTKLTQQKRDAMMKKLSPAQKLAYKEEAETYKQEIKDAAKASGLPPYIERGKYHAKQQLAKAIGYGRNPEGMLAMGEGLHAIEDYYSHSNFVEVCIWYLYNKRQLTEKQYTTLTKTEAGRNAALLGNMIVSQGGPQIITGTYAPGANDTVSRLELFVTEVEHGQLVDAFIKGACKMLGIGPKHILKKAAETGRSVGKTVGGAVGGVLGGAIGAVGGAFKGAGEGASRGWREHTGLSKLWHAFTGLFTGAASGLVSGAKKGWNIGKSIGGTVGSVVGGVIGGAVGLTIDAAIALVGVAAMPVLFPAILALRKMALEPVKAGIMNAKIKRNTLQAAQEASNKGIGPSHAELAKDDPHHHLWPIARQLAIHADRNIGKAMALAWEETRLRDAYAKSQQSPSPEVVASVTGLVDKYVSHPATDQWWMDIVKAGVGIKEHAK